MKALYDQIIQQGVLTDAEFWAGRQHLLNKAKGSDLNAQKAGLSTTMLADVQPSADGQTNRVTFRITPEMVPQIFSEKPEVWLHGPLAHHCCGRLFVGGVHSDCDLRRDDRSTGATWQTSRTL